MGVRPRSTSARLAPSMGGEGDRSLALESTALERGPAWGGRARLGADTHSHASHTPARPPGPPAALPPRKGPARPGLPVEEGWGPLAGSTWEAGPGAGRAWRPVHPHRVQRDADAPLGAPGRLPGCITCPRLSQDLRFLCLRGPGQRGRRSGEGDRPPHTLCRPV